MKHPFFSIITINFNNNEGLQKTVQSVLAQSCDDYEYIVIDGGSTDGSKEYLQKNTSHFTYWVSEPDNGCYHAMNKGIKMAKGEYLIFMNSGDHFYTDTVLEEVEKMNLKEDVVCGNMFLSLGCVNFGPQDITMRFFYEGGLPHQACFIKREIQQKHLYDESLRIVSDWKFFLKTLIVENRSYRKIELVISWFDFNGISSTHRDLEKKERDSVIRSMFPDRVLKDYEMNVTLDFRRLSSWIERTNFHRPIYFLNVLFVKCVSFFTGSKWIKDFSICERN